MLSILYLSKTRVFHSEYTWITTLVLDSEDKNAQKFIIDDDNAWEFILEEKKSIVSRMI